MPYMKFCGSMVVVLVSAFVSTFGGCTLTQGGSADGGVADPIPLRRAIQDGATDITVVLTQSRFPP